MQYVFSLKEGDYYVDFDTMELFFTEKTTRFTKITRVIWSPVNFSFKILDKSFTGKNIETYLLPLYSKFSESASERKQALQFARFAQFDLDDSACRNFNPFNGTKGQ